MGIIVETIYQGNDNLLCVFCIIIASYDNYTQAMAAALKHYQYSQYPDINLLHSFFLELHQSGAQLCLDPAPVNDTGMGLGPYGMGLGM